MKNKLFLNLFLFLVLLICLKIDYRFIENISCCGDDHDYFMHSETIAIDFDFDYSNQLLGNEERRYNKNNKIAPTGFVGSGLLAAPFLFIGSKLGNQLSDLYNLKILFYSFSPIFYLYFSYELLRKTLNIEKKEKENFFLLLLIFGSGISYYAFERYSMTHVYEFFATSLVIYVSEKFYNPKNKYKNIYSACIPLALLISFLIRWVNYYVILIPIIIAIIENKSKIKLLKNRFFYISSIVSIYLFLWFSKKIYGIYTFNPQKIYGEINVAEKVNIFNSELILNYLKNFIFILFGEEFGIFWFSPVIWLVFIFSIYGFVKNKKERILNLVLLIAFLNLFGIVLIWGSTGSSYGFRYLFGIIPLCIYIIIKKKLYQKKPINYYLLIFCTFSFLSTLFFETTELTQLSLVEEENIFGNSVRFTEPQYLRGYILSFFSIDSYLKIFTTSFLGVAVLKVLLSIFDTANFIQFLDGIGLPVNNLDFISLLEKLNNIENIKIALSVFFIFLFSYMLTKQKKLKVF